MVSNKSGNVQNLCGFEATEHKCLERNSPNSQVDDTLAQLTGATCFSKLMLTLDFGIFHLLYSLACKLPLLLPLGCTVFINTLWNFKCTRGVSNGDEPYFG